jgi:hypothetical protein
MTSDRTTPTGALAALPHEVADTTEISKQRKAKDPVDEPEQAQDHHVGLEREPDGPPQDTDASAVTVTAT